MWDVITENGQKPVAVGVPNDDLPAVQFYDALKPDYKRYGSQNGVLTITYGWKYDFTKNAKYSRFRLFAEIDRKLPKDIRRYSP